MSDLEYIEAQEVRRTAFRVSITPLPSLNSVLRDAAGAGRAGTPEAWCEAIRAHLRDQDYETLAPFITSGPMLVPDPLLGLTEAPGESLKDGVERMMATPVDVLAQELAICSSVAGTGIWREAERDPQRWLRRYVASLLRAWKGFGPVWRQARPALDREVERVGLAGALDAQLELLDGLLPHAKLEDGRWCVECKHSPGQARFPNAGLVLIPMVAGGRGWIMERAGDTVRYLSYPVRSALAIDPAEPPAAALEGLLGTPRAQILRAVSCPTSIGRLAEMLRGVPSVATHHVCSLEAAGLVTRDRSGRQVLVRRTARGEALLELYHELDRSAGRPLARAASA